LMFSNLFSKPVALSIVLFNSVVYLASVSSFFSLAIHSKASSDIGFSIL